MIIHGIDFSIGSLADMSVWVQVDSLNIEFFPNIKGAKKFDSAVFELILEGDDDEITIAEIKPFIEEEGKGFDKGYWFLTDEHPEYEVKSMSDIRISVGEDEFTSELNDFIDKNKESVIEILTNQNKLQ